MTDEQMQPLLDTWFRDRDEAARDVSGDIARVMADVPRTKQQGRWWPLPPFDRPVSTFPSRELAPAPIPATNGRTRPRGFTMFSAVKFVVAGVIVALFGGFLLAGVLTTPQNVPGAVTESPSPMTTDDLLPGVNLTVEEVEHGVFRVASDSERDLTSVEAVDIVAGYDGGVWLLRENVFLRLGSHSPHEWPMNSGPEDHIFEVAPDGTMWVIPRGLVLAPFSDAREEAGLRSTDGEEWTLQSCPGGYCYGLTVAPDGMVWATYFDEDGKWVGRHGPTGWEPLHEAGSIETDRLFPTEAGVLYGVEYVTGTKLLRYEDTAWERLCMGCPHVFDAGRDGSLWANGVGVGSISHLGRFADGEWTGWTSADLLPDIAFNLGLDDQFRVAPDGAVWASLWPAADGETPEDDDWDSRSAVCDGLVRFDRQTLDRFLPGRCISMDIAPDGSVWVLAADEMVWVPVGGERRVLADNATWDLYVITPEAVAATE